MTAALRLLARRARSEAEIRLALEARGVAKREIRRVLGRLRELGYIDDRKFAADWSERLQERGFGSLRIRDQLQKHGVEEKIVDGSTPGPGDEQGNARKALRERFGAERFADRPERVRAWRFLAVRGFPEAVVESILGVWEDQEFDER